MARDEPMVNIRMPASLKHALEVAAAREQRTVTKEIIVRLERSLIADETAMGLREDAADYVTAETALQCLPDDLRAAAVRLLCAAGAGLPQPESVDVYRKNQPAPRTSVRRRKKNQGQNGH